MAPAGSNFDGNPCVTFLKRCVLTEVLALAGCAWLSHSSQLNYLNKDLLPLGSTSLTCILGNIRECYLHICVHSLSDGHCDLFVDGFPNISQDLSVKDLPTLPGPPPGKRGGRTTLSHCHIQGTSKQDKPSFSKFLGYGKEIAWVSNFQQRGDMLWPAS